MSNLLRQICKHLMADLCSVAQLFELTAFNSIRSQPSAAFMTLPKLCGATALQHRILV